MASFAKPEPSTELSFFSDMLVILSLQCPYQAVQRKRQFYCWLTPEVVFFFRLVLLVVMDFGRKVTVTWRFNITASHPVNLLMSALARAGTGQARVRGDERPRTPGLYWRRLRKRSFLLGFLYRFSFVRCPLVFKFFFLSTDNRLLCAISIFA